MKINMEKSSNFAKLALIHDLNLFESIWIDSNRESSLGLWRFKIRIFSNLFNLVKKSIRIESKSCKKMLIIWHEFILEL